MGDINLARSIESTILGEDVSQEQIERHIAQAKELGVFAVCVPLKWVPFSKKLIGSEGIKVVTVIDFPLGQKSPQEKATEALMAKTFGADEMDMVLDYGALKNKDYRRSLDGIAAVVAQADGVPVKVIVESSALNQVELVSAITLVALSKAQFIKTSTGFHKGGAREDDIKLMRELLPDAIQIKASGGIRTKEQALQMLQAGATRIGTSRAREILLN